MCDPLSDPAAAKQKLVKNERLKITATALNTAAVAVAIASVVAPLAANIYGVVIPKTPYWGLVAICWLAACGMLHGIARSVLGGLEP